MILRFSGYSPILSILIILIILIQTIPVRQDFAIVLAMTVWQRLDLGGLASRPHLSFPRERESTGFARMPTFLCQGRMDSRFRGNDRGLVSQMRLPWFVTADGAGFGL